MFPPRSVGILLPCILMALLAVSGLVHDTAFAQSKKYTNSSIRKKEKELTNLKSEIRKYEKKLAASKSLEKNTLERIDDISKQTTLLKRLVSRLEERIGEYQREIEIAQDGLEQAEQRLKTLQRAYSKYIVNAYKRGRTHDTELLLSSESLNQMLIRSQYLKAMTQKHRVKAEDIRQAKRAIEIQKQILEARMQKQMEARDDKKNEEKRLDTRVKEHKTLLARARNDKAIYAKDLRRKRIAVRKIESIIAKLIEKERRKAIEAERKAGRGSGKTTEELLRLPSKPISQTAFGKLKGRLPWPVSQGRVVQDFGEHTGRVSTVTHDYSGIDIRVPEGTPIRSVADGTISNISFMPGFGDYLMIYHGEDFFTVYAHLKSISVKVGQKVKAGQVIAKSREDVSGPQIHFELWHNINKQNPMLWLARR